MEHLLISNLEHQLFQKHKEELESSYKVKLNMPDVPCSDSCGSQDHIFITIVGDNQSISSVKKFVNRKVELTRGREVKENDISVIVLNSDSDNDSEAENIQQVNQANTPKRRKRKRRKAPVIDLVSSPIQFINQSKPCEVSSTTIDREESVILLEPVLTAEEFIPLSSTKTARSSKKRKRNNSNTQPSADNTIVISSDEEEIPRPITQNPKLLRPVVIDGSNVARAHGKPKNTFSCKGIKLCVDYFLKRGHPQVTAFVPLYRRHCKSIHIPTTDQDILMELEKTQHVVFTPSRRVDGKSYTCYDDRFIVELAVANGGVILSNDNYKDLIGVSAAFKDTIEKRLLMFVFVGDMLMIPDDPLGCRGPTLEEFLCFPPTAD